MRSFAQQLAIVLTQSRRRAAAAGRRSAHTVGRAGKDDGLPEAGVELRLEIRIGLELHIVHEVGDAVHRRDRDLACLPFAVELLFAARAAELAEYLGKARDAL